MAAGLSGFCAGRWFVVVVLQIFLVPIPSLLLPAPNARVGRGSFFSYVMCRVSSVSSLVDDGHDGGAKNNNGHDNRSLKKKKKNSRARAQRACTRAVGIGNKPRLIYEAPSLLRLFHGSTPAMLVLLLAPSRWPAAHLRRRQTDGVLAGHGGLTTCMLWLGYIQYSLVPACCWLTRHYVVYCRTKVFADRYLRLCAARTCTSVFEGTRRPSEQPAFSGRSTQSGVWSLESGSLVWSQVPACVSGPALRGTVGHGPSRDCARLGLLGAVGVVGSVKPASAGPRHSTCTVPFAWSNLVWVCSCLVGPPSRCSPPAS